MKPHQTRQLFFQKTNIFFIPISQSKTNISVDSAHVLSVPQHIGKMPHIVWKWYLQFWDNQQWNFLLHQRRNLTLFSKSSSEYSVNKTPHSKPEKLQIQYITKIYSGTTVYLEAAVLLNCPYRTIPQSNKSLFPENYFNYRSLKKKFRTLLIICSD